jgi:hypothetical protein
VSVLIAAVDLNAFAITSLALFIAVFISTAIRALFMRRAEVDEFSRLPLEDSHPR